MPDYWEALERIAVPVDLVVGEQDDKFRPIAQRMLSRLPRARLHVVAGCGHNVVLERPDALAALLCEPIDDKEDA
jgi:pimeloyl-ACP methyl ester carboxylesterase